MTSHVTRNHCHGDTRELTRQGDTLHDPLGPDPEREVVLVPHSGESPVHSSHALVLGLSLVHLEIDHLSR